MSSIDFINPKHSEYFSTQSGVTTDTAGMFYISIVSGLRRVDGDGEYSDRPNKFYLANLCLRDFVPRGFFTL